MKGKKEIVCPRSKREVGVFSVSKLEGGGVWRYGHVFFSCPFFLVSSKKTKLNNDMWFNEQPVTYLSQLPNLRHNLIKIILEILDEKVEETISAFQYQHPHLSKEDVVRVQE
ncbi:hypothetical protein CEXT_505951 [Caerostris extrusa]|uniref:Uncharacterized protein n=1 Tax=Caerostris extrusa TaxID=172846 RepID=A0AAV4WPW9_CAEEX|nr:hypothetical protein CEXT_505951 [Caerostris extrusa]